ncbi:MAG: response regulator transcription factor [Candidatus Nanopelagicales bacterium]|nr:response regulator transcription factor [Candidatus Nanopelagicales bacterium]MCF8537362.1 response regulator transcription factor [Candidatus Nanopelagicales bacterium]MCF8542180.1 response regulator transcription factor [Candidatus Nanopelagicales bacterium]MCF8557124.1 response regulator transcription factor [Candidatus Nanopelagicales bacterium]
MSNASSEAVTDAPAPRVLVVEDDDFTRVTLEAALQHYGLIVTQSVADGTSAMQAFATAPPDVALLDLDLGAGPTGIDVAHAMKRARPEMRIVLLTSYEDPRLLSLSLRDMPAHAAYVVKQSLSDMGFLVEAIRGSTQQGVDDPTRRSQPSISLSDSQVETLRLLACGLTNAEIARVRVVEEKSVEQAVTRMVRKLDIGGGAAENPRVLLAREFYRLIGSRTPSEASALRGIDP